MHFDLSAFLAAPEIAKKLERLATPISCQNEQILFGQNDANAGLYLVRSGKVTLSLRALAGEELAAIEVAPGSLLGLSVFTEGQSFLLTATAHAGAELFHLTREQFVSVMQNDTQLALRILEVLALGVRSVQASLRSPNA